MQQHALASIRPQRGRARPQRRKGPYAIKPFRYPAVPSSALTCLVMIDIRKAVAADIEGLVSSSSGLFAEDVGTRDPTLSQDRPRLLSCGGCVMAAIRRH